MSLSKLIDALHVRAEQSTTNAAEETLLIFEKDDAHYDIFTSKLFDQLLSCRNKLHLNIIIIFSLESLNNASLDNTLLDNASLDEVSLDEVSLDKALTLEPPTNQIKMNQANNTRVKCICTIKKLANHKAEFIKLHLSHKQQQCLQSILQLKSIRCF